MIFPQRLKLAGPWFDPQGMNAGSTLLQEGGSFGSDTNSKKELWLRSFVVQIAKILRWDRIAGKSFEEFLQLALFSG